MKICGYCGNEYDEKEIKCPVCGSKLLKHTKGAETAADEYRRIEEDIKNKRKSRSMILWIGAGVIVLTVFIAIFSAVNYFNDPQRDIDKEAKQLYEVAVQQIKEGDFESAIATLDDINTSWSDYSKVGGKKIEAVKGQLSEIISKYESDGDYEAIVTYINSHIKNIDSDPSIKEIYERSVKQYKKNIITKSNEYINDKKYNDAAVIIESAIKLIGKDTEIQEEYRNVIVEYTLYSYKNDGYQSAIKIINRGLSILNNDSELENLKNEYAEYEPVSIYDCTIIDSSQGFEKESEVNDVYGNSYVGDNYVMWCCHEACTTVNDGESYATFYLGGKYSNFKGTYFINEWFWKKVTVQFTIYADDILIYDSGLISYDTKAIDFDVDIGYADKVTVKCKCSSNSSELALVNSSVYKRMQ